jgi:hypothetical protein
MQALSAPVLPCAAVDSTFARLLASERRRMIPALRRNAPAPVGPPRKPWNPAEVALLAAVGFFIASLVLHLALS